MAVDRPRVLYALDAALGVLLAVISWRAAAYTWVRPNFDDGGGPGRSHGPPRGPVLELVSVSSWIVLPLAVMAVGVAVRRRWPRIAFVLIVGGVAGYLAAGAAFGPIFVAPALGAIAMAMASTTSSEQPVGPSLRRWLPLVVLLVPMVLIGRWRDPYLGVLDPSLYGELFSSAAITVVPALFVLLWRGRRESVRREQEQLRRRTAYEERLRIARDVHDVVGHSLSVITMQAGVALHLLDKQPAGQRPEQVTASLEAIKQTSRDALAELRTTLGVFREPEDQPRAPVPGLARLDELVTGFTAAGRRITVAGVPLDGPPLPAAVDQTAFRIIQESLTNAARHAPASRATVTVERQPGRLLIGVADDGPAVALPEPGNGLRGMRERARAVGGSLELSVARPHGLQVRAELPLPEPIDG